MHEFKHRIILVILLSICIIVSIFGLILSFIDIGNLSSKSGIFECILICIANVFMIGVSSLPLYQSIKSFKEGSVFMKELTLTPRKELKLKTCITFLVLGLIGLAVSILFVLMICGIVVNNVFPKGLDGAVLSFALIVFVMGLSFSTYPLVVRKDLKETKKNELLN